MNIGIDARYLNEPTSGITRYTLNLLRGIAAIDPGFRIRLLVPRIGAIPEEIRTSKSFDLVEVRRNPRGLADQLAMPYCIRRFGLELLHSMDAFAPLLSSSSKKIVTVYDLIPLTCRNVNRRSLKAKFSPVWKAWLRWQCRSADMIVTPSGYSKGDIERFLNVPRSRIRVIPAGVEMPARPEASVVRGVQRKYANNHMFILYVGRRAPYKNLVCLIQAFAKVKAECRAPVLLLVVGAKDSRYPEPEGEVARLGLGESVVFTGHLSDRELASLYVSASVFVFPSIYEGFGLPPLEAMSYGTPVVASNRTAVPEAVGDAGILVDPESPAKMADAVLRVLKKRELASAMRRKGLARAREFPVERQAEETLRLYEELLLASRGRHVLHVADAKKDPAKTTRSTH